MKWDLDSHTSSRSLTHPAGNLNNKPAARNDHTAQPETEPALNRFALKPLALGWAPADAAAIVTCAQHGHGVALNLLIPTRPPVLPGAQRRRTDSCCCRYDRVNIPSPVVL